MSYSFGGNSNNGSELFMLFPSILLLLLLLISTPSIIIKEKEIDRNRIEKICRQLIIKQYPSIAVRDSENLINGCIEKYHEKDSKIFCKNLYRNEKINTIFFSKGRRL